ncbi:MAG: Hpt domain-containing protein, partial [Burkholderiales bacterium]|nr:Hpt domain-containing protein [Burkholderiales bacterium]
MAIDMSQFIAVFFDEAAEHLATMESILLKLSQDEPDSEDLNAIFRAAHSIKGGAATFGFTDLAAVTHILENLLDRIRKNELDLRADMIDVFLRSGDVLQNILSAHRDGGSADLEAAKEISTLLEKFANETSSEASTGEESEAASVCVNVAAGAAFDEAAVLRALEGYGELVSATTGSTESDWAYHLQTSSAPQEIVGTLAFAIEISRLSIGQPMASAEPQKLSDGDGYGFFTDDEPAAVSASQDGEGYGFFTDIAAVAPVPVETVADGAGYGFF